MIKIAASELSKGIKLIQNQFKLKFDFDALNLFYRLYFYLLPNFCKQMQRVAFFVDFGKLVVINTGPSETMII